MEIETLNAMNESLDRSLLMIIEVVALINIVLAIAGFAIYLAGVAWYCYKEARLPAHRRMKPAHAPQEPGEYDSRWIERFKRSFHSSSARRISAEKT
jgi:hypothetical protein